jgi:hypothetical protein
MINGELINITKILLLNSGDEIWRNSVMGEIGRYAVWRPQKCVCCIVFRFVSHVTELCSGHSRHWLHTSTLHILFGSHFRKCSINFTQIKQWSKVPWKKVSITDIWRAKSDKGLNYIIHWCSGLPWDDVWATVPEKYLLLPKKKFPSTQWYYAKYRFVSEYGMAKGGVLPIEITMYHSYHLQESCN